jgi:hypothetical protein
MRIDTSSRRTSATVLVTAMLTAMALAGCGGGADDGDSRTEEAPTLASTQADPTTPTPTERPAPAAWEPPGPLRPPSSRVVSTDKDAFGDSLVWDDPRDTATAGIDIVWVREGQDMHGGSSWAFQLAATAPRDPAGRILAYGVAIDGNGDHRADCQIGLNNDGPRHGDFHVWVTNLRTHETAVQDGAPYGMPVEFAHPAEREGPDPVMYFGFLRGLTRPDPCDTFDGPPNFYAWSSVTKAGQVVETDYAPDAAWLPVHCPACRRP